MSRTPAKVTQADVARIIRAAKQAGALEVDVKIDGETVATVKLSTDPEISIAPVKEIVL